MSNMFNTLQYFCEYLQLNYKNWLISSTISTSLTYSTNFNFSFIYQFQSNLWTIKKFCLMSIQVWIIPKVEFKLSQRRGAVDGGSTEGRAKVVKTYRQSFTPFED